MVQSEFALEALVHSFRAPTLLKYSDNLLLAHRYRKRGKCVFGRCRLTVGPLDEKPERIAVSHFDTVIMSRLDAHKMEIRTHWSSRAVAPGVLAKALAGESGTQFANGNSFADG